MKQLKSKELVIILIRCTSKQYEKGRNPSFKLKCVALGEKKIFPLRGNIRETTSIQQISMGFPSWKLPFSMWFPSRGNTLRSGFHASIAWKLGSTSGFPIWKIGGN